MSQWNPNMNSFHGGYSSQRHDSANETRPRPAAHFNAANMDRVGHTTSTPQNYVGFDDFVNQFQHTHHPGNQIGDGASQLSAGSAPYIPGYREVYTPVPQQFNISRIPPTQYYEHSAQESQIPTLVNNISNSNYNNLDSGGGYNENVVLRSNLTPTASEFIPKCATVKNDNSSIVPNNSLQNRNDNAPDRYLVEDGEPSTSNDTQKYSRSRVWSSRPNNQSGKYRDDRYNKYDNESANVAHTNEQGGESRRGSAYRQDRNSHTQRNGRQHDRENWRSNLEYVNKSYGASNPSNFREKNNFLSGESFGKEPQMNRKADDAGKYKRKIKIENPKFVKQSDVDLSQRDSLSEQLNKGKLECLVCCDRVRQTDEVWSCNNCYHVFHLKCIKKWATSSMTDSHWRCPACQNTNTTQSLEYLCLCGRERPAVWRFGDAAHSCGQLCSRPRPPRCTHSCVLLCHPGPCPPCEAVITRKCECGATSRPDRCSSDAPIICTNKCNRLLNCRKHKCVEKCHSNSCILCDVIIDQVCGCPAAVRREVVCAEGVTNIFSCEAVCGRDLSCGHHKCTKQCHEGECPLCPTRPDAIKTCPCGQTRLSAQQTRRSCLEPVPLCGKKCSKPLPCGTPFHQCQAQCHDGSCPPCALKTNVTCRCRHSSKDLLCVKLEAEQNNVRCQKKCNKPMLCGKHMCRTICCDVIGSHQCQRICGRLLGCSGHRCPQNCHAGTCPPCSNISFTELRCACGESVVPPPVACGMRVDCRRECIIERPCGHPAHHYCHQPPTECPPCLVQTAKQCFGGHEERRTIPCHQEEFSCGMPCGKQLGCGKHKCLKICHKGECTSGPCKQACQEIRPSCSHPCAAPCHFGAKERQRQQGGEIADEAGDMGGDRNAIDWGEGDVEGENKSGCSGPVNACKAMVRATCQCGHRTAERPCSENAREYQRLASGLLANRMQDVQLGLSIDLADLLGSTKSGNSLKTLECNEECRVLDRNRRFAIALQLRNPDLSSKLTPRYSDFMKEWMQRDVNFCTNIHEKLTELVQLAKKSKQKTRSVSFPSMNRQKRQFVHEMCEHFGCESVSYDEEPNRNVVATADKEKSWLPAKSLMEVVGRQNGGVRRVPGPILRPPSNAAFSASSSSISLGTSTANKTSSAPGRSGGAWATLTSNYSGALRNNTDNAKPANTTKK